MIFVKNNIFHLQTKDTSYIMRVEDTKHLVLEYYGQRISLLENYEALYNKWTCGPGCSVIVDKELSKITNLDILTLEASTTGKGDYNSPSIILNNDDGYVFNFLFEKYVINKNKTISTLNNFPTPHKIDEELIITLVDKASDISIDLHYLVFSDSNIIARNIVIQNHAKKDVHILKAMSYELAINDNDFEVINLYGGWSGETKKEFTDIKHGLLVNDSKTGSSSNRHNPFFMLKNKEATFNNGDVYAFNLIYSGNHYESIEKSNLSQVRIMGGISPFCFDYVLKENENFETPYAVLTYSASGLNGASQNMHKFVNNSIIPSNYANKARPILINNWEATYFKFTQAKLLSIAKKAKECGIELFVLDDGWFKNRNDDKGGLGNYEVNTKKLPSGLNGLAKKLNNLGLDFGLWFEPEMVSKDSDLFIKHPEYAISHPGFSLSEGRNQYCLNLTMKEVQDYIVDNVLATINSANIKYVKWDYNRPISDFYYKDNSGEFFYRYMIGFYNILRRVTEGAPKVLFEGCASGGNRFDLGVLSYFHQNWASDNTDGLERNYIQSGLFLGYPQSCIGAHVSVSPSQSALRNTSIDTRFNVAAFGLLGYELNLNELTSVEIKAVKNQVKFYKEHRELLQYGTLYQFSFMEKSNHSEWMVMNSDHSEAIYGYYNGLQVMNPKTTCVHLSSFKENSLYSFKLRPQEHNLKEFGSMINFVLPIHMDPNGFIMNEVSKHKTMEAEKEDYIVDGAMLNNGAIKLTQEWCGTGFDNTIRFLGDFGSRLYYIKETSKSTKK